jgi:hypothetical protein
VPLEIQALPKMADGLVISSLALRGRLKPSIRVFMRLSMSPALMIEPGMSRRRNRIRREQSSDISFSHQRQETVAKFLIELKGV